MLSNTVKPKYKTTNKAVKILLCIVIAFSLTFQKPKEADAFIWFLAAAPVIAPQAFATAVAATLAVAGSVTVGVQTYNDNKDLIHASALASWDLLSDKAKNAFIASMANVEDGFELSKEYLDHFLAYFNSTTPVRPNIDDTQIYFYDDKIKIPSLYKLKFEYPQKVPIVDSMDVILTMSYHSSTAIRIDYRSFSYTFTQSNPQDYVNRWKELSFMSALDTLNKHLNTVGVYISILDRATDAVLLDGHINDVPNVPINDIYQGLDDLINPNNSVKLGIPVTQMPNLQTLTGESVFVDSTGQLVLRDGRPFDDIENLRAIPNVPSISDVAGVQVPTMDTPIGKVNIKTGEIVTPSPNPPVPNNPTPQKKPDNVPKSKWQQFLPVAVVLVFVQFLKAVVMYAIRLFDFLLALPMTPAKSIENHALMWFMEIRWLGIKVYDTVIAFATFCFSFAVYKVIRKIW